LQRLEDFRGWSARQTEDTRKWLEWHQRGLSGAALAKEQERLGSVLTLAETMGRSPAWVEENWETIWRGHAAQHGLKTEAELREFLLTRARDRARAAETTIVPATATVGANPVQGNTNTAATGSLSGETSIEPPKPAEPNPTVDQLDRKLYEDLDVRRAADPTQPAHPRGNAANHLEIAAANIGGGRSPSRQAQEGEGEGEWERAVEWAKTQGL
jgi:hypothetical protein